MLEPRSYVISAEGIRFDDTSPTVSVLATIVTESTFAVRLFNTSDIYFKVVLNSLNVFDSKT